MNIKELEKYFNSHLQQAKRLSGKFPNLRIFRGEVGFDYYVKNPTEDEFLQATGCYLKSINEPFRLFYDEPGIFVQIFHTYLDKYKSLEDLANTFCPGEKFLEKLKSLIPKDKFDEINRQMTEEWRAVNEK